MIVEQWKESFLASVFRTSTPLPYPPNCGKGETVRKGSDHLLSHFQCYKIDSCGEREWVRSTSILKFKNA